MEGSRSGFTLVELLIVTSIVGVLLAMAFSLREGATAVDSAARELSSLLLAAQSRAVLGQRDVVVRFDTLAGRVTVREEAAAGETPRTSAWVTPDGVRFGRGPAAPLAMGEAAATFRSGPEPHPRLIFHRSGSASEWGGIYLSSVRARHGYLDEVRALEVDRGTARVTRWRHDRERWVRP